MNMIQVRNLTRRFDGVLAVDSLDVDVAAGEILGLVGINGAGKTTFLRMLSGILPPTSGSIVIAGRPLAADAVEARKHLAFVPDTPMLFDALTVHEHLLFIATLYRVSQWMEASEELLETFEMADRRHSTAGSLSRGMRQKLAICCAFLHEPDALLLDEPLTGLDPPGRRLMSEAIRRRAEAGSAVIVSSHQLEFVERLSDRFLIIHEGRRRLEGTLAEIHEVLGREGGEASLEDLFLRATDAERDPPLPERPGGRPAADEH